MVKLKSSTNVWKPTLGVSPQKSNIFGYNGYLWLNGGITPTIMPPPKFYGPYQVLQHIGEVAYKLALPPTAKIDPVFHVSCLKKVIGNNCRIQTRLPELDEKGSIWLQPE